MFPLCVQVTPTSRVLRFSVAALSVTLLVGLLVTPKQARAQKQARTTVQTETQTPLQTPGDIALTLAEALRLAQARSHQLPAQDAAAAAARDRSVAAAQRPDPVIRGGISNLPIDGPARYAITRDFMTMRSIGLMQEFTRESKRNSRSVRFQREAELAEAAHTSALAELQRETASAWLALHFRQRMLAVMQGQRREAALQVDAADSVYRGGRGAPADALAARATLAMMDDELQMLARDIASARTRLARWVGDAAQQPLGPLPAMAQAPWAAEELAAALQQHPRVEWLERQVALARAEADMAQSERQADWSAELMFSQRGPAYSNMLSLTFSIPLQWDARQRQDREWSARQALVQRAQGEREEALREALAATRSDLQAWQANRARLAHFDATLLPLAAQRVQAALAAYRGAAGPLDAVLEARRNELNTQLARLRIEWETAELWARLHHLIPARRAPQTKQESAS